MNKKIDPKLYTKVKSLKSDSKLACIIRTNNLCSLKKILKDQKIEILNEYLFINSVLALLDRREIEKISSSSAVCYISSLTKAETMLYLSKKILNVDKTHLTGKGVNVAIIDTGISPHLDFCLGERRIKKFVDFVSGKKNFYDDNGHGTFVSGVIGGSGALSGGKFSGVAPKCKIYSLKALDQNGEASANKILDAMQWVYDFNKKENIKVVCMSFGSDPVGYSDPIMLGAEALWKEGVCVVTAAGNSGPEFQTIKSPGVSQKIITVGGLDDNRSEDEYNKDYFEIAEFSSRGPAFNRFKPDVVAPSVDIVSTSKNGGYTTLSGTSVATPMIAGLVCLMLEKDPNLLPSQIKKILQNISRPISFNKNLEGFGLVDFSKFIN